MGIRVIYFLHNLLHFSLNRNVNNQKQVFRRKQIHFLPLPQSKFVLRRSPSVSHLHLCVKLIGVHLSFMHINQKENQLLESSHVLRESHLLPHPEIAILFSTKPLPVPPLSCQDHSAVSFPHITNSSVSDKVNLLCTASYPKSHSNLQWLQSEFPLGVVFSLA